MGKLSDILAKLSADPSTSTKQDIGNASLGNIDEKVSPATTITEDYITIVAANTEYSKALPTNCKKLTFRCVDSTMLQAGSDIRYAFTTGKVATPTLPFQMLDGGAVYSEGNLNLTSKTLYVAGITAGNIVLLEMWS